MKIYTRFAAVVGIGGLLFGLHLFLATVFKGDVHEETHQRNVHFRKGVAPRKSPDWSAKDEMPNEIPRRRDKLTAEEYSHDPEVKTGNPLIDEYDSRLDYIADTVSSFGKPVITDNQESSDMLLDKYHIDVSISDRIPLNRHVPDARLQGCSSIKYDKDLPTTSVIIPFYDEWLSVLLRTVYSIINRTPRHILKEIILVDDNSAMSELKGGLDSIIDESFPTGLVKLVRNSGRLGLIRSRLAGWRKSTGDVVIFFDSHMEVNIDWVEPLLTEIKKDRRTIAMSVLDYVQRDTFEYKYNHGYLTRYVFNWKLVFFEDFFRDDQIGPNPTDPRVGVTMVGAAYAVDRKYFEEIGLYDDGMSIWGGENLEMSWRVWMCGGRLIHLPCSHVGHIARHQPYDFPGGRGKIEVFNYKRAVEVWVDEPYKKFIYDAHSTMQALDPGDLSTRLQIKQDLKCRNFTWFLNNIWPEMTVFDQNVQAWGSVLNPTAQVCLDTNSHLFQYAERLSAQTCHHLYDTQGFSLTKDGLLRSALHCVVQKLGSDRHDSNIPHLEGCIIGPRDKWQHEQGGHLKNVKTSQCLTIHSGILSMKQCEESPEQKWVFMNYAI